MSEQHARLRRAIGLPGAIIVGLGSILGTGVFVSLAIGAEVAGSGLLLAIVIGGLLALWSRRYWLMIMAGFLVWQAINGLRVARVLALIEKQEGHAAWRSPLDVHERSDPPQREST